MNWTSCKHKLPPEGEVVLTKIDDDKGCRNVQALIRGGQNGRIWFLPGSENYVYYEPTHWNSPSEHWRKQVCHAAGIEDLLESDWPQVLGALAGKRDRLICFEDQDEQLRRRACDAAGIAIVDEVWDWKTILTFNATNRDIANRARQVWDSERAASQ